MKNTLIGLAVIAALAGCAPAGTTVGTTTGPSAPKPTTGQRSPTSNPSGPAKEQTAVGEVAPALKHAAYQYYGFEEKRPLKYLFSRVEGVKPTEGVQTSV